MRDKREHRVLAVREFQDKDYKDVLKRPVFCSRQEHQKEELKYYCKECEMEVCQTCFTLDHAGHGLKLIKEEAESQKLEIKSIIERLRHKLDSKINVVAQLDEDYAKVIQQSEIVKKDVQRFADGLMKTIQTKTQNIITTVENQTKKLLEGLTAEKSDIQHQINVIESSLEEAEKRLKRSTSAEVIHLKKSLQTIFQGNDQTKSIAQNPASLQTFVFVENRKMLDVVKGEEIGSLEEPYRTKANECVTEGEGVRVGTVGRKAAQFNLITRNAERNQWYDKRDRVTVEIVDEQERECVTEVRINDNKNGIYNISYYPRVQGTLKLFVSVNREQIQGSPFTVIVKPFHVTCTLAAAVSFVKEGQDDGTFEHRVEVFHSNGEGEKIGSLEEPYRTKAKESVAEGEGLKEGTVGLKAAKFNLITRNAKRKQGYDKRDRVTVVIKDRRKRKCVTEVRINDNKNGIYNISYYPRVQGTLKLFVNVNGERIRGSPFTVIVKPFQVNPVLSFGKKGSDDGMFQYPYGMAVNERDDIVVAEYCDHCVQVFDSNGTFLRSFGRSGENAGEFCHPSGIAIDKDRNIFVADKYNHRVQIFNWEGRPLGSFGREGSLDSQLSCPLGLSLDSTGNVIVADRGNKLIKIFTPDGGFVMKIGGQGSLTSPYHCVQCGDRLIVSEDDEHCIKVFNREGNFQYKFGKQGEGEGEFNFPGHLSVTQSNHLLVCDGSNHRVQVFELDGKFVGKVGTEGSKIGELLFPRSVAVLSNDQIVVSDTDNHRIQIFE